MDNHLTIRLPKRLIKATLVFALVAAVISPIAVSASHVFDDVDDSNIFHEDIAWLANAGITLGCNPPSNTNYCPNDNVTRAQMSAFMRRLAENQVVDAASVGGYEADSLVRATGQQWPALGGPFIIIGTTPVLPGTSETVGEVTINAPVAGALVINGSLGFGCSGPIVGPCNQSSGRVYVNVDGERLNRHSYVIDGGGLGTQAALANTSNAAYVTVAAGDHTVALDVENNSASAGTTHIWDGGINVVFVPFGGDGATP